MSSSGGEFVRSSACLRVILGFQVPLRTLEHELSAVAGKFTRRRRRQRRPGRTTASKTKTQTKVCTPTGLLADKPKAKILILLIRDLCAYGVRTPPHPIRTKEIGEGFLPPRMLSSSNL